jgi:hypothetical protein
MFSKHLHGCTKERVAAVLGDDVSVCPAAWHDYDYPFIRMTKRSLYRSQTTVV